jgi:hypothetical protein
MHAPSTSALIDRLQRFPARVATLLEGIPASRHRLRPPAGGFSLTEHLCHLRDLEREGFLLRIRRIVDEDMPELQEIDGTTLAEERGYQAQDLGEAWQGWRAAREETVAALRGALPVHGQRTGIFGGFGVVTLETLAEGIAAHDEQHWGELGALADWRGSRLSPG